MPRKHPDPLPAHVDLRARLGEAGRAAALQWMRGRACWLPGELCQHLIADGIVQTRRGLLIEAFRAVDDLHRELIDAGQLQPIPAEHGLQFGWVKPHG